MPPFSLQARWLLPVDRPPIAGGVVTIADGHITALGDRSTSDGPLHDLGDVVLMPGLVNVHTHLEFSQCDEPLGHPGIPLPEWLHRVIANRQRAKRNANAAIVAGLRESLQQGVTTVGDIATSPLAIAQDVLLPNLVSFQEAIGFSAARVDSVLTDIQQRTKNSRDATHRRRIGLSPHAPYSVHPRLLERLIDLACEQGFLVAMHLAESPEELEFLAHSTGPFRQLLEQRSMWDPKAISPGSQPLDYLKVLARAPRAMVVHGNYLTSAEIRFLAEQRERMSVAYCPRTHAYFRHTAYPLQEMLAAGARVALGTDSRASNPDLCLLSEMRYVARRHSGVSPQEILRMGTMAGAESLGMSDMVGSIAPGKWADLTAVPCDAKSDEPEAAILHSDQLPTQIWLHGQLV